MKPSRHFSQILQWSVVAVVVAVVIATGFLTNITLRSIEKNLPITLLTELEALDLLLEDLAEVVSAAEATKRVPNPENYIQLRIKVKIVFDGVVKLRETYVFDNLIQASAFHAVVAPAISDIQLWLVEGVSGYGPETATTLDIAISRITEAFSKARTLNHDSHKNAQKILNKQRIRLEHFLLSVNLLFLLTLTITVIMIFLVARRHVFLRQELEAQIELGRAEKTLRESEERFKTLSDKTPLGMCLIDIDGRYEYVNPAFVKIFGYDLSDIPTGKEWFRTAYPDPEYRREVIADWKEDLSSYPNLEIRPRIYEVRCKGGDFRTIMFRPVTLPFGKQLIIYEDITERKQAEKQLQDTLESLRKAVGATMQVMVAAVETRDPYTSGHQKRSADLARAIAAEMGLPPEKIEGIRMAGSIHDIGKLSIPAEILSKPTKLSEIEFSLIKEHAKKGYEMLKDVESPWPLAEIVRQHHERMDGSGYPRNLKGDDILIETRILSVADVVEAMASHRPYRPGLGIDAALNEIEKNRGILYDNVVADACLRLFREKGFNLEGLDYKR
ncbi:MAG: HD domain-containing protein [Syntrophaceae bacterium]|nr:HD domain-containing protein [Syntrophaceae bacterium]